MLMTRAARLCRSIGSAARVQRTCDMTLTSKSPSRSASDSVSNRPGRAAPALLTRMSIPPRADSAWLMNAVTSSGSVTSQRNANTVPPGLRSSAAASSSSASLREQMTTCAPSASSSAGIALPRRLARSLGAAGNDRPPGCQAEVHLLAALAVGLRRPGLLCLGQGQQRLARRAEHVHLQAGGVGGPCAVRHPGRDHGDVSLAHRALVTVDVEGHL